MAALDSHDYDALEARALLLRLEHHTRAAAPDAATGGGDVGAGGPSASRKILTALGRRQLERRALRQAPAVAPLVGFGHVEQLWTRVRCSSANLFAWRLSSKCLAKPLTTTGFTAVFPAGPRHGPRLAWHVVVRPRLEGAFI